MINISEPYIDNLELKNIKKVLSSRNFTDGFFQNNCEKLISKIIKKKVFLTQSCSSALEIAAILINLKKNDEVLIPSYTFSSTANAIVHRGARPVFVDIDKKNLSIDLNDLEKKITKKTKAIFVVHYAGNCCDLDLLIKIKNKHKLFLVEDAAHAFLSKYKNQYLGTFGDIGTFSFYETKDFNGGQCGALVLNNKKFISKVNIILDKGTDRKKFLDFSNRFLLKSKKFYSWKGLGSEYRASELSSALLFSQFQKIKKIQKKRESVYSRYIDFFSACNSKEFSLIEKNKFLSSSYHLFLLIFKKTKLANKFKNFMRSKGIAATIHYVPLHSSSFGRTITPYKKLKMTEKLYKNIVRLPLHSNLSKNNIKVIFKALKKYF